MKYQTPRGTRDFLPEEMIKISYVISKIRAVFEKWGFDPMSTPAFEEWPLLSSKGGEEVRNEIYYFKDKSDRELGLRFDLTVPFARVLVSNPHLPKPFRRYQIAPVWRYDRPGAGRYREFWQADVDIAGAPVGDADALCIAVACDALRELGVDNFSVRLNNRKIVEAFLVTIGLKESVTDVLRSIDKLEKMGQDAVSKELSEKKIPSDKIKKIMDFLRVSKLPDVKKMVSKEKIGEEGVAELESIFGRLESFGFSDCVKFDLSLVRGLEYYTGPVFEVSTGDGLSAGGGGRYDKLIESFGGPPTPATGISFGVDRLMLVLENKLKDLPKTNTKVYVATIGNAKDGCMHVVKELVSLGIPTEFDVTGRSVSKQLDYANAKGIPYVIVIGEKEVESRKAKLRDMKTGDEHDVHLGSLHDVKKIVK